MKSSKIIESYRRAAPDDRTREQILRRVLSSTAASPGERTMHMKRRNMTRVALTAAIIAACMTALGIGGYAAVQSWSLPDPTPMPAGHEGNYDIHQTSDYGEEALRTESETNQPEDEETLSDVWFIREAVSILNAVGLADVSTEEMSVIRQNNLPYNREEAEVVFTSGEVETSVTFRADNGRLQCISSIDGFEELAEAAVGNDKEAEACARRYMEKLPVPQDYKLSHIEKYDACYWTLDFSREIEPGVFNVYETVRISVNPQNGRLTGLTVFNFPLIDDHDENDVALTLEEALKIGAEAVFGTDAWEDTFTVSKAEVGIVLPNWVWTDNMAVDARYAENTRYAWDIRFVNPNSECADECMVWVDLYTGEVLGGDRTA